MAVENGQRVFTRESAGGDKVLEDDCHTVVGRQALMNNIRLRRAVFSEVRLIEEKAFLGCTTLRKACFPNLERIKAQAFENCVNLKEFSFGGSFGSLGKGSFYKCKRVRSAVFDANAPCREIPALAFAECRALEELVLPGCAAVIGNRACYRCTSLEKIVLPDTLEEIGNEAFYQCGFSELALPEGLRAIGESAFLKCRGLRYIRIPPSVEHIGKWAFHGCSSLKVLEIGHDPAHVGSWITNKGCTIRCPKGSAMEEYAHSHGMAVEYL